MKKKALFIILSTALAALMLFADLYSEDVLKFRYRAIATSPNAILGMASLGDLHYSLLRVRLDTVYCNPVAYEARLTYSIRFENTVELMRRVRRRFTNGCCGGMPCHVWDREAKWSAIYYASQHIRVWEDGSAILYASYPIDYSPSSK